MRAHRSLLTSVVMLMRMMHPSLAFTHLGRKRTISRSLILQPLLAGRYSTEGWDDLDVRTATTEKRSVKKPKKKPISSRGGGLAQKRNTFSGRPGAAKLRFRPFDENRIHLKAIEQAGFDHLYGLSPILNALQAGRRDFTTSMTDVDDDDVKPEAQKRPWLLVQQSTGEESSRSPEKSAMASRILDFAESYNLPIHYVDKGVLNTLSNNRPHQGFVLRCGKLDIQAFDGDFTKHRFWLVLDQITDPQNLGALLRSAQFLQCPAVLVCTKNSAPPSAVVSAASAGALESYGTVYATNILPRVLNDAPDSVRILGAATTAPVEDVPLHDLSDIEPTLNDDSSTIQSTVLVLGSEGHGLRFAVARACTDFCRIPGTTGDSLNVSVSGGIFLWHLLQGSRG